MNLELEEPLEALAMASTSAPSGVFSLVRPRLGILQCCARGRSSCNPPPMTSAHRMLPARIDALALVHEFTASDSLRKHMLAVEAAMRAYAEKNAEDVERWGLAGLTHDFDYERYPNNAHSPTQEHPVE